MELLQTRVVVFGRGNEKEILWRNGVLAILWYIWKEGCESFSKLSLIVHVLWDWITYLASLWPKAAEAFKDYPISVVRRSWACV